MRIRLAPIFAAVCLAVLAGAAPAAADTLQRPSPLTAEERAQIIAAGAQGMRVGEEELNLWCPGYAPRGVSAGACIVDPSGCTANFIFASSSTRYIGTARHCVEGVGQKVIIQVDTLTLVSVGTVTKMTSGDGDPGHDFALIKIDPAVAKEWGINPALPQGGPQGIYTGCGPVVVTHYGHGYGVVVAQGKLEGGVATNFNNAGFGWTGFGVFGDSGSAVVNTAGQAVGNFTHLIVDTRKYPGSTLAGTRITKILSFAGVRLVNANGTTTGSATTRC